jgi:hypothetical protein
VSVYEGQFEEGEKCGLGSVCEEQESEQMLFFIG